jgi:hypothetical protein
MYPGQQEVNGLILLKFNNMDEMVVLKNINNTF